MSYSIKCDRSLWDTPNTLEQIRTIVYAKTCRCMVLKQMEIPQLRFLHEYEAPKDACVYIVLKIKSLEPSTSLPDPYAN